MHNDSSRFMRGKIRELLEPLERSALIDALVDLATTSDETANYLEVRFGKRDEREDLDMLSSRIDNALEYAVSSKRLDSWGHMHIDTSDIFREIEEREKQGLIRLAFSELELLLMRLYDYYEYQEECELEDEIRLCVEHMVRIAASATNPGDKDFFFDRCIAICTSSTADDYGSDSGHELMKLAMDLITPSNRGRFDSAMVELEKGWGKEKYKLIRLESIRRHDGDDAANVYIYGNLVQNAFREIAYRNAISKKDFDEAARLCLLEQEPKAAYRGYISPWLYNLLEVYELSMDTAKQIDTAKSILMKGDFKTYEKLKGLLISESKWEIEYTALLKECAEQMHFETYMQLLRTEGEKALLLEQIQKHPEMIFSYGNAIAASYPEEVKNTFIEQINKESNRANDRKGYQSVCRRLTIFAEAGYVEAAKVLIAEYKANYRNRPAFTDELSKLLKRI